MSNLIEAFFIFVLIFSLIMLGCAIGSDSKDKTILKEIITLVKSSKIEDEVKNKLLIDLQILYMDNRISKKQFEEMLGK